MGQAALSDFVDEAPDDAGGADDDLLTFAYRFDPDATCAACGAAADEAWRDGGRYVCPDCKDW